MGGEEEIGWPLFALFQSMSGIGESNHVRANAIEKTTNKLVFVFLTILAMGGGISPASIEAVEATSVIENIATREIDSPAAAGSGNPNLTAARRGRRRTSLAPRRVRNF
jgi:hypothetical protein